MGKILTTLFGAGFVGSLYALRTYLGIALILMVSTCSFKTDIVDYVKESRKEAHQERLAQINYETEKLKIESEAKVKLELEREAKAKAIVDEQIKKEKAEKAASLAREQERVRKEKEERAEIERVAELKRQAHEKMCTDHFIKYKRILACGNNPTDTVNCAQGYSTAQWYSGANTQRQQAQSDSCPVDKPFWKN